MCGITSVISFNDINIINDLYESLYHLQHRGQDSYGFSYIQDSKIVVDKNKGLINMNTKDIYSTMGIGHVRYPTKGHNTINEVQPLYLKGEFFTISLVHNGQIWKTDQLIEYLDKHNIILDPNITSDSVILLYLISYYINKDNEINENKIKDIVLKLYTILEGSFNIICLIEGYGIICFKDQYSIRPLIIGVNDDNCLISSESVSLDCLNYSIIKDIYNNEIYILTDKIKNIKLDLNYKLKPCIFEWVYLAREESVLYNVNVYDCRYTMGKYLAKQIKKKIKDLSMIDCIIPVPDTSKPCALSLSKELKIPYYEAITKNRYIMRTFIMENQEKRKKNIKRKLNVVKHLVDGKNIIIVDDSIVRGNTILHIIELLKLNNAKDIYVVSSCPEIINENKYGIDIPNKTDLICYQKKTDNLKDDLDIKEIIFQDLEDLKSCIWEQNSLIKDFECSIFCK